MFTKRNMCLVVLLTLFTGGLYAAYWFIATKFELNDAGARVPTGFFFFIPIVNFYFLYEFAHYFADKVLGDTSKTIGYFLLFVFLMPIGVIVGQTKLNKV